MNKDQSERYQAYAHAMQSGVAAKMTYDPHETEPKHLRVGINSAMAEGSALARLLIAKGIITMDEYAEAIVEAMSDEVAAYETELAEHFGKTVILK